MQITINNEAQALKQRIDSSNVYCILPTSLCIEASEEFEDWMATFDIYNEQWQYGFEYAYFWSNAIAGGHDHEGNEMDANGKDSFFGCFSDRNPVNLPPFLCVQLPVATCEEALEICDQAFSSVWDDLKRIMSDEMFDDTSREDLRYRVRNAITKVYGAAEKQGFLVPA